MKIKTLNEWLNERSYNVDFSFVTRKMKSLQSKLVGKNLGNLEIIEILNKNFYIHGITFEVDYSGNLPQFDTMMNSGILNAYIGTGQEIVINVLPYFYEIFEYEDEYLQLIKVLQQVISHELVHRTQIERIQTASPNSNSILAKLVRNPNDIGKYLTSKHEIQAFAVEAVTQFRNIGYSDAEILKILRDSDKSPENDIVFLYYSSFNPKGYHTSEKARKMDNDTLKRFLKYMYEYIITTKE